MLVAGFGNLQGQMDIYDREKMTKITTIEASNASVCEWSPDGQHILTATTSPRLRVDNGVKIWHFTGALMYLEELTELYNVYWRPQPVSMWPLGNSLPAAPAPHTSAATHTATHTPVKPSGAYRPPHARGTATPLAFKREDEGGAAHVYTNGGSSTNGSGLNGLGKGPRRREVPGAAPGGGVSLIGTGGDENAGLTKASLKNKKKREAKKAKEAAAAAAAQEGGSAEATGGAQQQLTVDGKPLPTGVSAERLPRDRSRPQRGDRSRSRSNRPPQDGPQGERGKGINNRRSKSRSQDPNGKQQRGQSTDRRIKSGNPNSMNDNNIGASSVTNCAPGLILTVPTGVSGPLSPVPGTPSTMEEKKMRGLHKKLRAIEDLKMRLAAGEKLEDTQLKKIATEQLILSELEMLGGVGEV